MFIHSIITPVQDKRWLFSHAVTFSALNFDPAPNLWHCTILHLLFRKFFGQDAVSRAMICNDVPCKDV